MQINTHINTWRGRIKLVFWQGWIGGRWGSRRGHLLQQDAVVSQSVLAQLSTRLEDLGRAGVDGETRRGQAG